MQLLRKGLVALVALACVMRVASPAFHSHSASEGVALSAPCYSCDIDATAATAALDVPVLPAVPFIGILQPIECEAHPFIGTSLTIRGRAPPSC
jgi:hypothetical protein